MKMKQRVSFIPHTRPREINIAIKMLRGGNTRENVSYGACVNDLDRVQ